MVKYLDNYYELRSKILDLYKKIFDLEFNSSIGISINEDALDDLYDQYVSLNNSDELFFYVNELLNQKELLNNELVHELEVINERSYENNLVEIDYKKAKLICEKMYKKAKINNDYSLVAPYLKELVEITSSIYITESTFDSILSKREHGYNKTLYDDLFNSIDNNILDMLNNTNIMENKKVCMDKFNEMKVLIHFGNVFGVDFNKCHIYDNSSSFMDNYGNYDIRIAHTMKENDFFSTFYECMHEYGHAIYELQGADYLNSTFSWGGASTSLHESQAKIYENLICHNDLFWETNYDYLNKYLSNQISLKDILKMNHTRNNSIIRTESDEISFFYHILIRYELEKMMFSASIDFNSLNKIWDEMYYNYFKTNIKDDSEGILQDPHWFIGNFGYFPTYILGNIYACQIFDKLEKNIDIDSCIVNNNYVAMNNWLKNNLHKYGSSDYPSNIFNKCVGESVNPKYYIKYLSKRYGG